MQTDLKSDNFCGYNQEASPFYWLFMPGQYENTYTIGEVGVPSGGGMAGSYVRPDVIDISSFLSGRDDILSKCTPPSPSLESLNEPKLYTSPSADLLLPKYTKELRSANSIDAVDYNRWSPNLPVDPQNVRFVIEDFANQRGGFDSRNFVKSAWSNQNNSPNYDPNMCKLTLDPARACGPACSDISGYPGIPFGIDGLSNAAGPKVPFRFKEVEYVKPNKPQPDYPFEGISSQDIAAVGAAACGPQFFHGLNYDIGSCPPVQKQVLRGS